MPRKPAAASLRATDPATLVLKVTLLNIEPACWRRLVVESRMTLDRFHDILQVAFDWDNSHLHEFRTSLRGPDRQRFGPPDEDGWSDPHDDLVDSTSVRLNSLLSRRGAKLFYLYDFGDTWEHEIRCEKVIGQELSHLEALPVPTQFVRRPSSRSRRPPHIWAFCQEGAGRTPPEDCGGPWGYAEMLPILADPSHDEHADRREWLGLAPGETWDPNQFDVDAVNRELARMR